MAVTDRKAVYYLTNNIPYTHRALQDMLLSIRKALKNDGKKSFILGRDKGKEARLKFYKSIDDLIGAMRREGLIFDSDSEDDIRIKITDIIDTATMVYPNWGPEYGFAADFFLVNKDNCNSVIKFMLEN